jgi:enoyl-CoA hydratase/carnithine racemase
MEQSRITEWEVVDNFGILTINNPPQNFLTELDIANLADLKKWTANESLRGLIVQGKGRHFSAGANPSIVFAPLDEESIKEKLTRGKAVLDYLWDLPIPTIAAIKGVCFGGGLEIALSCHVRVCSEKSLFAFPESGLGIMPGLHGSVKLPRIIGMANAIDMLLTAKTIDAQEALRLNLVDYVVPSDDVFDFALNFLKKLTKEKPLPVIHAVVQSLVNARKLSEDKAMERLMEMYVDLTADMFKSQIPKG